MSFAKGLCSITVLVFKLVMIAVSPNRAIITDDGKVNSVINVAASL